MAGGDQAMIFTIRLSADASMPSDAAEIYNDFIQSVQRAVERPRLTGRAGEFDGTEWGEGTLVIYCYGRDARRLFGAVEQLLKEFRFVPGSYLTLRFGEPGAPEEVKQL